VDAGGGGGGGGTRKGWYANKKKVITEMPPHYPPFGTLGGKKNGEWRQTKPPYKARGGVKEKKSFNSLERCAYAVRGSLETKRGGGSWENFPGEW